MTPKLSELKNEIVKAVPGIMELDFGCKIKVEEFEDDWEYPFWEQIVANYIPGGFDEQDEIYTLEVGMLDREIVEILGRDITLEDVLIATDRIRPQGQEWSVRYDGHFRDCRNNKYALVQWKMGAPLHEQSEATIEFLHSLLVTNK